MYEIIPGILEKDWEEIDRRITLVLPFAKTIHIDIVDGKFAPNTSFLDPAPFKKYSSQVLFELHMMVEEPINYLKPFADAGFKRFLGHVEKMSDPAEFVAAAQLLGEVGLAIDHDSHFETLHISPEDLDVVLFMTIRAGFSGQAFMPEDLKKVTALRSASTIPIEVDGGISDQTIVTAKDAGTTRFITTSFLFRENPEEQFRILQKKLQE